MTNVKLVEDQDDELNMTNRYMIDTIRKLDSNLDSTYYTKTVNSLMKLHTF